MPLPNCSFHNLQQNVICFQDQCSGLLCAQCFKTHNEGHLFGVYLKDKSQQTILSWITFLIKRLEKIRSIAEAKGYLSFLEMKLSPEHPKGLVSQLSMDEINQSAVKSLTQYCTVLKNKHQAIEKCQKIAQLNTEQILKDIFMFFINDTSKNISQMLEKMQSNLQSQIPHKQIYRYVRFVLAPREIREIQARRKEFVQRVEEEVLVKLKYKKIPYSPSLRDLRGSAVSPKHSRVSELKESVVSLKQSPMRLFEYQNRSFLRGSKSPEQSSVKSFKKATRVQSEVSPLHCSTPCGEKQLNSSLIQQSTEDISSPTQQNANLVKRLNAEISALKQANSQKTAQLDKLKKSLHNTYIEEARKNEEIQKLKHTIAKLSTEINDKNNQISNLFLLVESNNPHLPVQFEGQFLKFKQHIFNFFQIRKRCEQVEDKLYRVRQCLSSNKATISQIKSVTSRHIIMKSHNPERGSSQFEQEEIVNEIQTLLKSNKSLLKIISQLSSREKELVKRQSQLQRQNRQLKQKNYERMDEKLLNDVIELEAAVSKKNQDIYTLIQILQDLIKCIPEPNRSNFEAILEKLKCQ